MKKIMFVCHGNICRSPMAEFLFRDKIEKIGLSEELTVSSSGTSSEEEGNPVYPPVRRILAKEGIDCSGKYASVLTRSDYERYDMFIAMDSYNQRNIMRIFGSDPEGKVSKILDFTEEGGDVADPYYYGNYDKTYADICRGIEGLVLALKTQI